MPDWNSPEELQKDAMALVKLVHALLGLYAFEWLISLDFEWDFITGKKKFRWPMIFYFANRYLMLFTVIAVAYAFDSTTEIDCYPVFTFLQLAGDSSIGLASVNLSIRTMAIWSQNRFIIGGLVLLILGHFSIILQSPTQLKATWIPGVGCDITETNNNIFAAMFIYAMCFDLIVLLLNAYQLLGLNSQRKQRLSQSRLSQMIFSDGLIYFFVAFGINLLATVFVLLRFNKVMGVIFNGPASVFSTIAACRAVRRLTNFSFNGPEILNNVSVGHRSTTRPGVHVQMETYTHQEEQNDIFLKSKSGEGTDTMMPDVEARRTVF